jgi:hypothetical protein
MRQRHPFENKYCTGCQCTTRHEVKESTFSCLRCGAVKYPSKIREALRISSDVTALKVYCA